MKKYTCNHVKKHTWTLKDEYSVFKHIFLIHNGWVSGGYCYKYYPKWLDKNIKDDFAKFKGV